jgi:Na+/citrate or Na+/malate symporter
MLLCNKYLLLNALIKLLKFLLSSPVATNCVYISGVCMGFSLSRVLLHSVISTVGPGALHIIQGAPLTSMNRLSKELGSTGLWF